MRANINIYNEDCLPAMKKMRDKEYELAIVDTPYGLGNRLSDGGGKLKNTPMAVLYKNKDWDVLPNAEYWNNLFRVTKNQIIFGANYFLEYLPSSRGIVCWDKKQYMPTLSAWELVWTSFDKPSKMYKKSSTDLNRFHPTQKPIQLYKWLLTNYAKAGDKILDTHLGSGSIALACWDMGFDLTGYELDKDYYEGAIKRLNEHKRQGIIEFIK